MHDSTMVKLALVMVLIGLPLLALLSWQAQPPVDNASMLTDQEHIRLNGTITWLRNTAEVTQATIETCMEVPIVMFDPVPLSINQRVEIQGKKGMNQGKLQIMVDELVSMNP